MFNNLSQNNLDKHSTDEEKNKINADKLLLDGQEVKKENKKMGDVEKDIKVDVHTMPDRFLGKLDGIAVSSSKNKGKKKKAGSGGNKTFLIILVVGFIFLLILGGVAFFFLRSINNPDNQQENQEQQVDPVEKNPLPVCSPFNCDLCSEEECLEFLDSCHLEESLVDVDDEKVFVQNCLAGSKEDYEKKQEEKRLAEEAEREAEEAALKKEEHEKEEEKILIFGQDFDNDLLTEIEEEMWGTDSTQKDTDGDSFDDGLEILNLYSPLGDSEKRLSEDKNLVDNVFNEEYGFSFLYPVNFSKIADSDIRILLQSDQTSEYFEVAIFENVNNYSLLENVFAFYRPTTPDDFIKYDEGYLEMVSTLDGLTYYVLNDDYVFQIHYNPSIDFEINYLTTFKSLINSFEFINNPFATNDEEADNEDEMDELLENTSSTEEGVDL